jgi:hypothetical protein
MMKINPNAQETGGANGALKKEIEQEPCRASGLRRDTFPQWPLGCGRSQARAIARKNTTSISVPECGTLLMWNCPRLASTSALVRDRLTPELSEA